MVQHAANDSIVNSDDHASFFRNNCPGAPGQSVATPVVKDVSAHDIFIYISIGCSAVTVLAIGVLMLMHLLRYTVPHEQRFLLRVLSLPAIYAVCNLLSIIFYGANIYIAEIPKICEAVAIASLFELFSSYVTPGATKQERAVFYQRLPRLKRVLATFWQWGPNNHKHENGSLRWYTVTHLLVFQYVPVSVILAITTWAAAASQCSHGKTAQATKLILEFIGSLLISVALYGLIEYERRMKHELAPFGAKRKLWGIKLFVGVSVSLNVVFAIAQKFPKIDIHSPHLSYYDLTIGVPDVLFEFCMLFFAAYYFWAFHWQRYTSATVDQAVPGKMARKHSLGKALADWLNPMDIIRGCFAAFKIALKVPFGKGPKGIGYTADGSHSISGAPGKLEYSPEQKPAVPLQDMGSGPQQDVSNSHLHDHTAAQPSQQHMTTERSQYSATNL